MDPFRSNPTLSECVTYLYPADNDSTSPSLFMRLRQAIWINDEKQFFLKMEWFWVLFFSLIFYDFFFFFNLSLEAIFAAFLSSKSGDSRLHVKELKRLCNNKVEMRVTRENYTFYKQWDLLSCYIFSFTLVVFYAIQHILSVIFYLCPTFFF